MAATAAARVGSSLGLHFPGNGWGLGRKEDGSYEGLFGGVSGSSAFPPLPPAGRFGLAAPPSNPTALFLNGSLDKVRVFP